MVLFQPAPLCDVLPLQVPVLCDELPLFQLLPPFNVPFQPPVLPDVLPLALPDVLVLPELPLDVLPLPDVLLLFHVPLDVLPLPDMLPLFELPFDVLLLPEVLPLFHVPLDVLPLPDVLPLFELPLYVLPLPDVVTVLYVFALFGVLRRIAGSHGRRIDDERQSHGERNHNSHVPPLPYLFNRDLEIADDTIRPQCFFNQGNVGHIWRIWRVFSDLEISNLRWSEILSLEPCPPPTQLQRGGSPLMQASFVILQAMVRSGPDGRRSVPRAATSAQTRRRPEESPGSAGRGDG